MADFIAVIRRAVDGLTENSPEMRVKVYERARGAVQRQLENMKPRPPETMLQRQLEKLEAAIREVEAEHAEAAPVDEQAAAFAEAEVHEEPTEDTPVAHEPDAEAYAAPAAEEPVYESQAEAPSSEPDYAAQPEPVAEDVAEPEHVEAEPTHAGTTHAEAGWQAQPAEEAPSAEPYAAEHEVATPAEPAREEWHAAEPEQVPAEEPAVEEPVHHEQAYHEPVVEHHTAAVEDVPAVEPPAEASEEAPAEEEAEDEYEHHASSYLHPEEHAGLIETRYPEEEEAEEPAPEAEVQAEPVPEPEPLREEPPVVAVPRGRDHASNRLMEPVPGLEPVVAYTPEPQQFVEHSREEPLHADAAGHFDPVWSEPVDPTPAPPPKDAETQWAEEELRDYSEAVPAAAVPADASARAFDRAISNITPAKMPAAKESFSWEAAAFDDLPPIEAVGEKKETPAPVPAPAQFDDVDIFAEVHGNKAPKAAPVVPDQPSEEWREAKPLRGYDRRTTIVDDDDDGSPPMDLDQIVASKLQGKSFRMEPKRRRFSLGKIIAYLIVLGVLGGGAYAGWTNRETVMSMVDGLVSSATQTAKVEPKATTPVTTTPPAQTPTATAPTTQPTTTTPQVAHAPATTTPATQNAQTTPVAPVQPPAQPNQQVASLNDGTVANDKFTQRLMADGTEVDTGPAAIPGTPVAEGKSVAEQNVASTTPAPAAQAPADATPAETLTPNGPAATSPQSAPIGTTQKMFLYEERIGQSSPTAIEGSVIWSVQHEAGQEGRQEATVQGSVTVPERNLTALVTFKRNSDPSLPASHLVEIVFSLPPNFEGGSIESVQRISMKRTEQDRGDALIAVPAKITDDFHMIALNDYPDARKSNLDLLGTRNWIDIPVTYRNGRRALLTMEKGTTGTDAFNTAIKAWAALGDVSTSQ